MKVPSSNEGIRLKNWSTGEIVYDTLHSTSNVEVSLFVLTCVISSVYAILVSDPGIFFCIPRFKTPPPPTD